MSPASDLVVERLDNLTSLISSGSTPKGGSETYLKEGPVMLIRSQNVRMNELDLSDVAYITSDVDSAMARSQVQTGDVLLNITGASIGRVASFEVAGARANVNQHVCIIRPKTEALFHGYLRHLISTNDFQAEIDRLQHGGTRQALTFSQIADFKIPLPPTKEQRRIAEVLDRAEALRAKRRAALAQLDTLTQSIFLDLFGDPATNPEGWSKQTLGDIATFVGGGTPSRARPEFFEGTICWATSKDMKCEFLEDTEEHVTAEAIEQSAAKLVPAGTILIVVKSKILAHSLPVAVAQVSTCFGQDLKGIKVSERCEVPFVTASLRFGKRWLLERARGINTEGLTLDHLRAFPLVLPPIELQRDFSSQLAAVDKLKSAHRASLAKLDALFASLQHRAFRGEL